MHYGDIKCLLIAINELSESGIFLNDLTNMEIFPFAGGESGADV